MGLLQEGEFLEWAEIKKFSSYIRRHGVDQFLIQYHKTKDRTNDPLMWGDEVTKSYVKSEKNVEIW